jgi:outer membrane receptor protein involved in Fe transport
VRDSAIVVAISLFVGLATAAESPVVWNRAPTNLPAQDLGSALRSLALQRKFQIVFASKEVASLHTQGAVGELSVDEALEKILSGTGLTFVHLEDGTIAITRPGGTPAEKSNQPDPISQSSDSESGTGSLASDRAYADSKLAGAVGAAPADSGKNSSTREIKMSRKPIFSRLSGVFAALFAATAIAQSAAPAPNEELAEVMVTGSRVITNGNDSPTPVTVISVEEMEAIHPSSVADQLNDMPQFSGSRSPTSNSSAGSADNGNPNPQANVLSLRNFGAGRTLILFDGHRVAPTSPDGTVDVDMIPQLLLQRVDVVTGGASAVYGADAVTGVVNFVTNTKFNGLKVNAQAGQSVFHDDPTRSVGVAWGSDLFGGRGHAMASFEHRSDTGVDYRTSRPYFVHRPTVYLINGVYQLVEDATQTARTFGGLIAQIGSTVNPLAGQTFISNGVLAPLAPGIPLGSNAFMVGGGGAYPDTALKARLDMDQLFGRFDYDIADNVHGYARVAGTYNHNNAYSLQQFFYNAGNGSNTMIVSATNPYLAQQYQTTLANARVTTFNLSKVIPDAPRQNAETFEHQVSVDTGMNVKFANGYEWDTAFIYSKNNQKVRSNYGMNGLRFAAAMDAMTVTAANVGTSGQTIGSIVCNVTLTNPGLYPGCVPYNPFGPSTMTPEVINYVLQPVEVVDRTSMQDVETSLTGAPFNSWAGPVNMALSAQWRRLTYGQDSSTVKNSPLNPLNCTGLRFLTCTTASQQWQQVSSASSADVSQDVKEAALEFDMPLLKDKPLARDVSLNAAVRYTNYSTSGSVYTWKAGVDWKFSDSFSFRGTRSRDIRAPTLFDLYAPAILGSSAAPDVLTGVIPDGVTVASDGKVYPRATTSTQGNPLLKPEVGNTTTAGIVYRPGWAQGLSLSLDAFVINLSDAIASQNGNNNNSVQACVNSGGTSPLCQLIVRPIDCCSKAPANTATAFYSAGVNLASQWTEGADMEINYASRWRDKPYSLRLLTSYQPHNVQDNPLTGRVENAGYFGSSPILRSSLLASISPRENWKVSILERWRHSMLWVPRQSAPLPTLVVAMPDISPVFYTNLNVGYTLKRDGGDQIELYTNITNLFDREPPVSAAYNNVQPGSFGVVPGDDVIGRFYTIGFRYRR